MTRLEALNENVLNCEILLTLLGNAKQSFNLFAFAPYRAILIRCRTKESATQRSKDVIKTMNNTEKAQL